MPTKKSRPRNKTGGGEMRPEYDFSDARPNRARDILFRVRVRAGELGSVRRRWYPLDLEESA